MQQIATPTYCFRAQVREYTQQTYGSGVDSCVWRELIQNARDAGASRVDAVLQETADHTVLTFRDNGKGMDRQTLIQGMLTYSGSIKARGNAGGFGMAKCLIVIGGPDRCEIRTQDQAVNVVGNGYEWAESTEFVHGTEMKLFCPKTAEDKSTWINPTAKGLQFLLARCDLRGMTVTLNGVELADRPVGPAAVMVREWPEMNGRAFWEKDRPAPVKADGNGHAAIVSHRGIWVMDISLPDTHKGSITIDLTGEAQTVLNSPRCSVAHYSHRDLIDKLIGELNKSPEAVLRPKSFTRRFNGAGLFRTDDITEMASNAIRVLRDERTLTHGTEVPTLLTAEQKRQFLQRIGEEMAKHAEVADKLGQAVELADPARIRGEITEDALKTLLWRPALMVKNERPDFDVPTRFFPDQSKEKNIWKLLTIWSELVREFLLLNNRHIVYGVGFVFSEETRAMFHRDNTDGTVWFLINPLDDDDNDKFSMTDEESRVEMTKLAAHEEAHMRSIYHDERFAEALTNNLGHTIHKDTEGNFRKIWKTAGRKK